MSVAICDPTYRGAPVVALNAFTIEYASAGITTAGGRQKDTASGYSSVIAQCDIEAKEAAIYTFVRTPFSAGLSKCYPLRLGWG